MTNSIKKKKRKSRLLSPEELKQHILFDLNVSHTLNSPVLLLGQPRSGTTILARMIRKYLKVNFGPESQFFVRIGQQLGKYGDLSIEQNARTLIADISRERCFRRNQFGFVVDEEAVLHSLKKFTYQEIVDVIMHQFAKHNKMSRWGDKTPDYISDLPTLYYFFPNAQFIHIIRDGRDVALSNYDVHFGAKNPVVAAMNWRQQVDRFRSFSATIPNAEERLIEIRYEDFMPQPAVVFERLIRFLKIDDSKGELAAYINEHLPLELKANNFQKWKKRFSEKEKRNYERVAGKELSFYGYETVTETTLPLNIFEKIRWHADHAIKKAAKSAYWKDNLYHLGIKLRMRSISIRKKQTTSAHSISPAAD